MSTAVKLHVKKGDTVQILSGKDKLQPKLADAAKLFD